MPYFMVIVTFDITGWTCLPTALTPSLPIAGSRHHRWRWLPVLLMHFLLLSSLNKLSPLRAELVAFGRRSNHDSGSVQWRGQVG